MDWTFANRFVSSPTCDDRRTYQILPYCDESGIAPTATPYPLPTATRAPIDSSLSTVTQGDIVFVNTNDGDSLRVRANPGKNEDILANLQDGTYVTIIDGPIMADDLIWWKIRMEDGTEGWAAESLPDEGIQMLVPNAR
jgi:hypothetical protein